MKNAIIGIDQSYTDTGIAIAARSKILTALSLPLERCENDTVKRSSLKARLEIAIELCYQNKHEPIIYIEAVRINSGQTTFDYIKRAGAMESVIIDLCFYKGIECRSVASNSWKAKIVGSREKVPNSIGIPPEKYKTYEYTHKLGLDEYTLQECSKRTRNYVKQLEDGTKLKYNDNTGDSCCIALYGCLPEETQRYNVLVGR